MAATVFTVDESIPRRRIRRGHWQRLPNRFDRLVLKAIRYLGENERISGKDITHVLRALRLLKIMKRKRHLAPHVRDFRAALTTPTAKLYVSLLFLQDGNYVTATPETQEETEARYERYKGTELEAVANSMMRANHGKPIQRYFYKLTYQGMMWAARKET